MRRDLNTTSLIAGIVFIIFGVLFLLERLGVIDVSGRYVVPIVLIAIGGSIVIGHGPRVTVSRNGNEKHDDAA